MVIFSGEAKCQTIGGETCQFPFVYKVSNIILVIIQIYTYIHLKAELKVWDPVGTWGSKKNPMMTYQYS